METHDRDQFNDLLDGALKHYSNVEPRTGLEGRVLANLAVLATRTRTRTRWIWVSALAGVSAAILVVGIWFGHRSGSKVPTTASTHRLEAVTPTNTSVAPQIAGKAPNLQELHTRRPHSTRRNVVAEEPKLLQFPSPRPASQQELMLVEYVQRYPEEAKLIAKQQYEFQLQVEQARKENGKPSSSDQQER